MRVPHAEAGAAPRIVETAARGRLVVWDTPGPAGAPTLVLLHGVTLDAESNWGAAVPTLAQSFRVLTLDLRGHGAGPPARTPYRLEDCADDVASAVRALGTGPVIVAGYSMGGMIAQEFWHRYPELTAGLVLCATARNVSGSYLEQLTAITLPFLVGALGVFPSIFPLRADLVGSRLLGDGLDPRIRRAVLARMRRMPLVTALAGHATRCVTSTRTGGSVASTSPARCWSPGTTPWCRRAARCAWPARSRRPGSSRSTATTTSSSPHRAPSPTRSPPPASPSCRAVDLRPGDTERAS